jgi:hypothetical protein
MSNVWIGLFDVTGPKGHQTLDGNRGACVWMAAQAESADHLVARVKDAMLKLGLTVSEAEQISEVINDDDLSEALLDLLPEARQNEGSVVCGTWHFFKNFDA